MAWTSNAADSCSPTVPPASPWRVPSRYGRSLLRWTFVGRGPRSTLVAEADDIYDEQVGDDSLDETETVPELAHLEHEAYGLQCQARQRIAEVKKLRQSKADDEERRKILAQKMRTQPCHARWRGRTRPFPRIRASYPSPARVFPSYFLPGGKKVYRSTWLFIATLSCCSHMSERGIQSPGSLISFSWLAIRSTTKFCCAHTSLLWCALGLEG